MTSLPAVDVLHVDEHLIVVHKPSGLRVHRGWDNDRDVMLFRVRDHLGAQVNPVHRLDRGTSGCLDFARTKACTPLLAKTFEGGRAEKTYLALVRENLK